MNNKFYQLSAKSLQGKEIQMSDYSGKTIIVVNTASKCGFTPQYKGLEELYEKYKDKGLVILGFPCNQFGGQEPGSEKSISENCLINYGVTFPMFSKIKVNGADEHPIFTFLKSEQGGFFNDNIKWNFTKFVINKKGEVVERFAPISSHKKIEKFIKTIL